MWFIKSLNMFVSRLDSSRSSTMRASIAIYITLDRSIHINQLSWLEESIHPSTVCGAVGYKNLFEMISKLKMFCLELSLWDINFDAS